MDGSKIAVNQWGLRKTAKQAKITINKLALFYHISTLGGQSGASVIYTNTDQELSIIGIHKAGTRTNVNGKLEDVNSGRFVTDPLIKLLQQEARNLGALPFNTSYPYFSEGDESDVDVKDIGIEVIPEQGQNNPEKIANIEHKGQT